MLPAGRKRGQGMRAWRGWWLLLLSLLVVLPACSRTPPEQALRDTIGELQQAIDERDAGEVENFLAADFVGNDGLDRTAARRMAAAVFLRHRQVGARIGPLGLELTDASHATVRFTAALSGGSGGLLPDSAQVYDVRTGWRLEGDEWRITSAEWTPRL